MYNAIDITEYGVQFTSLFSFAVDIIFQRFSILYVSTQCFDPPLVHTEPAVQNSVRIGKEVFYGALYKLGMQEITSTSTSSTPTLAPL